MTTRPDVPQTDAPAAERAPDRRQFLKVLGVTGAGTAALSGCSTDRIAKLVPYMVQSEQQVPGVATWYASTCTECSAGCGVHVKTREARAIKLEGNPDHPTNAGALCSRGQAGLQALYNPDRIGAPLARNASGGFDEISWDDAIARLAARLGTANGRLVAFNGYGPSTFSTLLGDVVQAAGGRTVRWEAFSRDAERIANRRTWGRDDLPSYDFAAARFIVSFGADFLETWGDTVVSQRGFAESHGFNNGTMAKHVYVGPRMNLTGLNADEWLEVPAGTEVQVALCFARAAAMHHGSSLAGGLGGFTPEAVAAATGLDAERLAHLAEEFAAAEPSIAVAGGIGAQHRGAIDLCHAVNLANQAAGNVGRTVQFGAGAPVGDDYGTVTDAFAAMDRGEIAVVLVHACNPLFALPQSGNFAAAFGKAGYKVSTANVLDETAMQCDLVLPNLHALARWDDLRPRAGVRSLLQPVMQPVRPGMHTGDVLLRAAAAAGIAAPAAESFEAHLKATWLDEAARGGAGDAEGWWRAALAQGGVFEAAPTAAPALAAGAMSVTATAPAFDGDGEFTFLPYPSSHYHDGRGANKPWLLENPDPVTKVTWQSWVELAPATAKRVDVREGEIVEVVTPHGSVRAQVLV